MNICNCGKQLTHKKSKQCHKCYMKYIGFHPPHISQKTRKICYRCKQIFYVTPSHKKQKFCSFKCYNPKYHQIKLKCKKCSKIFKVSGTPYILEHLPMYCSSTCCNRAKHFISHHIDLNKNNNLKSNKLQLTNVLHGRIHKYSYDFLVEKNLTKEYIKWFKHTFKNEFKKEGLL